MNRKTTWEKQGSYKSFNTGKPMIIVLDKATGATVLEPLHKQKAHKCEIWDINPGGYCNVCGAGRDHS